MIDSWVRLCFQRRGIVLLIFVLMALYGIYCWQQLPLEAYPDIAPVTSQVITQVNGLAAEEVEQQITIPLERKLISTPGMSMIRSRSTFGLSLITMVFDDNIEDYWSRERIHDTIDSISLPYNAVPVLDPLTSAVGEIYRYTMNSDTYTLRELSELQLWMVIPRLQKVKNVVDIANFGGLAAPSVYPWICRLDCRLD